ncbi:MAG: Deoxycytidylate deaminase [Parcubacteria group bacterium GW2011_GWA2_31_28]|nr:MAG: Deoxycytidylate deaminase [Parcubacteria group bacterium GW2011_GWA2_31_28]
MINKEDFKKRPSWNKYFMHIAELISTRATCRDRKFGAVIIDNDNKRILSTGYNGSSSGLPHCNDNGCKEINGHCVRTIHAEQNAIIQLAKYGGSNNLGKEKNIFVYLSGRRPCLLCVKILINFGVKKIIYKNSNPPRFGHSKEDEFADEILSQSSVELIKYNEN